MPVPAPPSPFVRFLSSVKGHLVRRHGVPSAFIGASRERVQGAGGEERVRWSEDEIVALAASEAKKYEREYDTAVREGALKERTLAEYQAWQAKRKAGAKEAAERFAAAREALAAKLTKEAAALAAKKKLDAPEPIDPKSLAEDDVIAFMKKAPDAAPEESP